MSGATQHLKAEGRRGVSPGQEPIDHEAAVVRLLRGRREGLSLRLCAALAGVHVATVCRWQARDPGLRRALAEAARHPPPWRPVPPTQKPSVAWHSQCPLCKAKVVVRTAKGARWFWRCGRWPWCRWASWRPRAPRNCKSCGGPRYWSHSRKTVSCGTCGVRTGGH